MYRLGSDPQKCFPFHALLDQLQKFGKYAMVVFKIISLIK